MQYSTHLPCGADLGHGVCSCNHPAASQAQRILLCSTLLHMLNGGQVVLWEGG